MTFWGRSSFILILLENGVWKTAHNNNFLILKRKSKILTANHHHGHWKHLLHIRGRSYVSKSYSCKACHGKVEWGHVQRILAGSSFPYPCTGVISVRSPNAQGQLVEPTVYLDGVRHFIDDLIVPNAIPYASQPVGNQSKHTHQEHEDCGSILQVMVQFPSHAAQSQEPHHFQRTEETADSLKKKKEMTWPFQKREGWETIQRFTFMNLIAHLYAKNYTHNTALILSQQKCWNGKETFFKKQIFSHQEIRYFWIIK